MYLKFFYVNTIYHQRYGVNKWPHVRTMNWSCFSSFLTYNNNFLDIYKGCVMISNKCIVWCVCSSFYYNFFNKILIIIFLCVINFLFLLFFNLINKKMKKEVAWHIIYDHGQFIVVRSIIVFVMKWDFYERKIKEKLFEMQNDDVITLVVAM